MERRIPWVPFLPGTIQPLQETGGVRNLQPGVKRQWLGAEREGASGGRGARMTSDRWAMTLSAGGGLGGTRL